MSFGFGVGDVIAVSSLARTIWGRFRDAPDQFSAIQNEVANLCLVLDEMKNNLSGHQTTEKQAEDLSRLIKGCRSVLDDTEKLMRKNESLVADPTGLGSKTHKAWKKLKWDSATVNELRDRMVSNATYLTAFNISLASRVSRATNDKVDGIAEDIQDLTLNQSQQEREAVLQWISPLNFAPQQSDLSSRRQEGTGVWLLESERFQAWKGKEGETLVCQGMPGTGKTMLTSLVVDHLQQVFIHEKITAIYIYCDYKRQDEQTPLSLIASLTRQLLQQQDSIPGDVLKTHQLHRAKGTRPSFEEVLQMTRSSMACSSRLYVILDALDELGNAGQVRQTLIGHLRPLQDLYHFSLMTTSRYIPSLALDFHEPLCMDIRASAEDVRRYVEGHILDLPSCVRKNLELQKTIASAVVDVVEGMFLLAQLHMDSLRDKTSPKMIKKALEVLPKGSNALDLAYDGAMQRIMGQMEGFQLRAKQLLGWLIYSERLMTVEEVQHALAIEPGTTDLDEDNLSDVYEIVALCAGLVIIDEETQIIRLAKWRKTFCTRPAGQDIAISCLTYLLYEKFGEGWVIKVGKRGNIEGEEDEQDPRNRDESDDGDKDEDGDEDEDEVDNESEDEDEGKARLQRYPFLRYAARYWATHAIVCEQQNVKDLTLSFVNDVRRISSASQVILALDRNWLRKAIDETKSRTPLFAMHFVAYLGHEKMISELLSHGFGADVEDATQRTPLWWAASQGHEAVVSLLLLQSNINVNNRGLAYNSWGSEESSPTPLGIAADRGKDKIVKLLIQREDVDVNMPDSHGNSPIMRAVYRESSTIVELLLTRRDIEVNWRNNNGEAPLHLTALYGRDVTAQQLLKQKDIQVNLADDFGWTPLATAAYRGLVRVMDVLLSRSDIEVNAPDNYGQTPLFKPIKGNQAAVVKLLLSRSDVDVNWKDDDGQTALAQALRDHNAAVVRLLCAHPDVDLDPRDNEGQDVFALVEEQRDPSSRFWEMEKAYWRSEFWEEKKANITLELDECIEILRTAIETRSRNEPQVLETVPA